MVTDRIANRITWTVSQGSDPRIDAWTVSQGSDPLIDAAVRRMVSDSRIDIVDGLYRHMDPLFAWYLSH